MMILVGSVASFISDLEWFGASVPGVFFPFSAEHFGGAVTPWKIRTVFEA